MVAVHSPVMFMMISTTPNNFICQTLHYIRRQTLHVVLEELDNLWILLDVETHHCCNHILFFNGVLEEEPVLHVGLLDHGFYRKVELIVLCHHQLQHFH